MKVGRTARRRCRIGEKFVSRKGDRDEVRRRATKGEEGKGNCLGRRIPMATECFHLHPTTNKPALVSGFYNWPEVVQLRKRDGGGPRRGSSFTRPLSCLSSTVAFHFPSLPSLSHLSLPPPASPRFRAIRSSFRSQPR